MASKLLVTQALDERALLIKKINDKIESSQFLDIKRNNEENALSTRISAMDFKQKAESSYQQIMDLIDRYQKIDAAIINSNAVTMIEISYGTYTVAAAIALRNRLKESQMREGATAFEKKLERKLGAEFKQQMNLLETRNKALNETAENMRLSILGKENRSKDDRSLEVVNEYVRENTYELLNPVDAASKIEALRLKGVTLLSELETQIKVSNATTFIEI